MEKAIQGLSATDLLSERKIIKLDVTNNNLKK
jgi:hypothetical protein